MTNRHETIASLADAVLQGLIDSPSALIYASNTTGKTRLAEYLKKHDPESVVLYDSFLEDVFTWDNQRVVLNFNPQSELLQIIETQGLDGAIINNFQAFTNGKIEPTIDFVSDEVSFGIHTGDDRSADGIKISRAEESIFVWCVYYSVLTEAIDTLSDTPDLRSTDVYDHLSLAVIDDPVSSMDDVRIVSVALALADLIKKASRLDLKFLITTHHALFFNVLFNALRWKNNKAYILSRGRATGWTLSKQPNDSPFSYHLEIIDEIRRAIWDDSVQRSHFNEFRALLEKTANFLGYTGGWGDLLTGPDAALLTKVLNLYSHDRFADPDAAEVAEEYKQAFKNEFQEFLTTFKWKVAI